MKRHLFTISFIVFIVVGLYAQQKAVVLSSGLITEYWQAGKTLPVEASRTYPWPNRAGKAKTLNVLIDLSHECTFPSLWELPGRLRDMKFNAVGSMASLNTILKKGGQSRIRIHYDSHNKIYPFGWWDNPEFNVVITEQSHMHGQKYNKEEIDALEKFVAEGGGLIILGSPQKEAAQMQSWSLNTLAKRFGASFSKETDKADKLSYAVITGNSLTARQKGEKGKIIEAEIRYKKGYVILVGNLKSFWYDKKDSYEKRTRVSNRIKEAIGWVAQGKESAGRGLDMPETMYGGGAIYPELERKQGSIVLYYAANQKGELLKCVKEDIPTVMKQVEKWYPSIPSPEPMYLILCAGDYGGWAVNAFKPKENGIISLSKFGVLSVFGHELAHTMGGPGNTKGIHAVKSPVSNQGEAHAGWFQGKVNALYDDKLKTKSNRECNKIFDKEGVVTRLDLAKEGEGSTTWRKIWYVWQKLDDRYGTTWYPRWKWVQYTRWADSPGKKLSWDEMVEDMSIAVGEDLFPFFIKLGTTLSKKRLGSIQFQGKTFKLDPAPIEPTPAGAVKLDNPRDHTKPLVY